MSDKVFEKVKKYVSKEAFTWIIKDSLSPPEISNVLSRCGINYRGMRSQSMPSEMLAKDIAAEVYKNPKAQQLVKLYLDQANKTQIEEISSKSKNDLLTEITGKRGKMMQTGNVGKYLWALIADQREETSVLIPIFIGKVISTVKHFTKILKDLERTTRVKSEKGITPPSRPLNPIKERYEKKLKEKQSELDDARATIDKYSGRIDMLEEKYDTQNKKFKELLTENQKLKHDFYALEKEKNQFEKMLESLQEERKKIDEMTSNIHHLERENKKLNYDLEKIKSISENYGNLEAEKSELRQKIDKLNERISVIRNQLRSRDETIAELRKEKEEKFRKQKKEPKRAPQKKTNSVGVFVDVQNIYYAAREKYDAKLDYHKLLSEIIRDRKLYKAVAYVVKTPDINQENFIDALNDMGYEVKCKDLKIRHDGSAKGDWDLGIAIDMVSLIDKMDVVVLVSGDGDFVDLVKMMETKNIPVEVFSFPHNTAQELIDAADYHYAIDERMLINKSL